MEINISALSNSELNQHLEARHSRTSGTREAKEERLRRFLDFEDQKKLRNNAVQRARDVAHDQMRTDELRAVRELLFLDSAESELELLQPEPEHQLHADVYRLMERLDSIEDENFRLNNEVCRLNVIADTLERRISNLEMADMPPLEPLPDSNPYWIDDTSPSVFTWDTTHRV